MVGPIRRMADIVMEAGNDGADDLGDGQVADTRIDVGAHELAIAGDRGGLAVLHGMSLDGALVSRTGSSGPG